LESDEDELKENRAKKFWAPGPRSPGSAQQCTVIVYALPAWAEKTAFWTQLFGLLIALLALGAAAWQITQARKEARADQKTQLKERRIEFELTVLRELLVAATADPVDGARVHALAATLPVSVVPITRKAAGLTSTEGAQGQVKHPVLRAEQIASDIRQHKDAVIEELVQQIDKRVDERARAAKED